MHRYSRPFAAYAAKGILWICSCDAYDRYGINGEIRLRDPKIPCRIFREKIKWKYLGWMRRKPGIYAELFIPNFK